MTIRQRFLKFVYPLFTTLTGFKTKGKIVYSNPKNIQPLTSFYSLSATLNNGETFLFEQLKGKKVLLVNTASDCGFTGQYDDLQKLYDQFKNKLEIIAFPANDFKEQEKNSDDTIAEFCRINYGVNFPLGKKSVVVPNDQQNPVFKWLSDKNKNGWNDHSPSWNFTKYLVNENGILTHFFAPSLRPTETEIINAVKA